MKAVYVVASCGFVSSHHASTVLSPCQPMVGRLSLKFKALIMCSAMWLLDLQKEPPPLALSMQIAGQQAAAASLECAAQLAAAAWRSGQHSAVCTTLGALLSQSFQTLGNGRLHTSQHQQVSTCLPQAKSATALNTLLRQGQLTLCFPMEVVPVLAGVLTWLLKNRKVTLMLHWMRHLYRQIWPYISVPPHI